jgi:RNA polymerase sigma-70 factor (ECF subfamily)
VEIVTSPLAGISEPIPDALTEGAVAVRSGTDGPLDEESRRWLDALTGTGRERADAIERLHALLLRAARFEIARRERSNGGDSGPIDDLALQAADDALVAVLGKLDTYRGKSRFTTWACKFALLEAAVKVRRRPWQGRDLPLEVDGMARVLSDTGASTAGEAEASRLMHAIGEAIAAVLTPHQRAVLVALTLNDVPIDVLAERRGTTRNALYKTLHDARRKLRAELARDGFETG